MELAKALRDHNRENEALERNIAAASIVDKLKESLAPPGTFNIPMILEERRQKYLIPNGAFEHFPLWDKVYIWQIPTNERSTYADGGNILKPEARLSYDRNTSPRGVIVSCGLKAYDALRSTGADIGHIVRFKKYAPFMQEVAEIDGKTLELMVIRDGDIVSSEDVARQYHERLLSIVNVAEDKDSYDFRFAVEKNGEVRYSGRKLSGYDDPSV